MQCNKNRCHTYSGGNPPASASGWFQRELHPATAWVLGQEAADAGISILWAACKCGEKVAASLFCIQIVRSPVCEGSFMEKTPSFRYIQLKGFGPFADSPLLQCTGQRKVTQRTHVGTGTQSLLSSLSTNSLEVGLTMHYTCWAPLPEHSKLMSDSDLAFLGVGLHPGGTWHARTNFSHTLSRSEVMGSSFPLS